MLDVKKSGHLRPDRRQFAVYRRMPQISIDFPSIYYCRAYSHRITASYELAGGLS